MKSAAHQQELQDIDFLKETELQWCNEISKAA